MALTSPTAVPWIEPAMARSDIRFDYAGPVAGKHKGTVFTDARVELRLSLSDPEVDQSARHIPDAQQFPFDESCAHEHAPHHDGALNSGSCARGATHGRQEEAALVAELGIGLNTRHERVDNGRARWYALDLPDVIGPRRNSFTDRPRRTMIAPR